MLMWRDIQTEIRWWHCRYSFLAKQRIRSLDNNLQIEKLKLSFLTKTHAKLNIRQLFKNLDSAGAPKLSKKFSISWLFCCSFLSNKFSSNLLDGDWGSKQKADMAAFFRRPSSRANVLCGMKLCIQWAIHHFGLTRFWSLGDFEGREGGNKSVHTMCHT